MPTTPTVSTTLAGVRTAPGSSSAASAQQTQDEISIGLRQPAPARVNPDAVTAPTTPAPVGATYVGMDGNTYDSASGKMVSTGSVNPARAGQIVQYGQSIIDSINGQYNTKVANDKEVIAGQDARARVLNTRQGLNDSGTGSAAIGAVQEKGAKVLAADEAARNSAIGVALGKVDQLKSDQAKADAAQAQKDLVGYNNLRAANTKAATDSITALGKSGVDAATLKSKEPGTYASLQKELGYSDLQMTAAFNNAKGAGAAKMQYKIVGNTVVAYGVDSTGKLVEQQETVPGLDSTTWEVQETKDGNLILHNKQTGDYKAYPKSGTTSTSDTSYTKNQQTDAKNWLARQAGFNQSVDYDKFASDPTFQAWAIQQSEAEKAAAKKKGSTTDTNPFADTSSQ